MNDKYSNALPAAFSFRELMDKWDEHCLFEKAKEDIGDMLDNHELSLFFKKGEDYFGAPENSRIIFAKLKNDDEDDPGMLGFRDQAKFIAINLLKSMIDSAEEDPAETMFGLKDIPDINVCDRDEVIEKMITHKPKKKKDE